MQTDWTRHWRTMHGGLLWKFWVWRITRSYRKMLEGLNLENPSILELGSGSGSNSFYLAKLLDSKNVTLVDSNKKALRLSKELFKNSGLRLKLEAQELLKLKLKEKFDLVHSEGLIEHFYNKDRLEILRKHSQFCKKQGFMVIFLQYDCLQYKLFRKTFEILGKWIWDEEPLTKKEFYNYCKKLNWKILKELESPLMSEIGFLIQKA